MKEKFKLNFSQRSALSTRESLFKYSYSRKNFSTGNKPTLFNHKSSLETLLDIIKAFQLEYFSKQTKDKNKTIKQMLSLLKDNLNLMLREKNKKCNYIKNQNESIKKKVQKILFYSP